MNEGHCRAEKRDDELTPHDQHVLLRRQGDAVVTVFRFAFALLRRSQRKLETMNFEVWGEERAGTGSFALDFGTRHGFCSLSVYTPCPLCLVRC